MWLKLKELILTRWIAAPISNSARIASTWRIMAKTESGPTYFMSVHLATRTLSTKVSLPFSDVSYIEYSYNSFAKNIIFLKTKIVDGIVVMMDLDNPQTDFYIKAQGACT